MRIRGEKKLANHIIYGEDAAESIRGVVSSGWAFGNGFGVCEFSPKSEVAGTLHLVCVYQKNTN